MIKVTADRRVEKFLEDLSEADKAKINRTIQFFEEKGFLLETKYLKKLVSKIWELRAGRVRLLFGLVGDQGVVVNGFIKKTQKTPLQEIKLAEKRLAEYL